MTTNELETGTFTDKRDGQVYRTVKMPDGKVWMAQNLNYKIENSCCYANDDYIGKKYGRLYTWDAAMKACPTGWRLPSLPDWTNLVVAVGNTAEFGKGFPIKNLMVKEGWNVFGTDEFGFSALPGGFRCENGDFLGLGNNCVWWACGQSVWAGFAEACNLCGGYYAVFPYSNVGRGCSVRCVQ